MPSLGTPELLIITFLAILFFGKDKLPDLAKSIGQSVKAVKDGISGSEEEAKEVQKKEPKVATSKPSSKAKALSKKAK